MAVPVWYVRSHKDITGRWIVGPWSTTSTSRSGHTPAGRQSAIPKRSCVEIVILNAMCLWPCWSMVGGVPWPEMAASPGSVGSWRPVIWCLFPIRGHHTDCAAVTFPALCHARLALGDPFQNLFSQAERNDYSVSSHWESIMKAELAPYDEEVSGSQLNVLLILRPAMNSRVLHGCFSWGSHLSNSLLRSWPVWHWLAMMTGRRLTWAWISSVSGNCFQLWIQDCETGYQPLTWPFLGHTWLWC